MVSALLEGRNFIGIEKNEDVALFKAKKIDYIEIAKNRLIKAFSGMDEVSKQSLSLLNLLAPENNQAVVRTDID